MEPLGGECVFASEIEKLTREVYVDNFDECDNQLFGDITKVEDDLIPNHDILVGGFP
eukprot:Pgem_evm1s16463